MMEEEVRGLIIKCRERVNLLVYFVVLDLFMD